MRTYLSRYSHNVYRFLVQTAAEMSQLSSERGVTSFHISMADVHQMSDADLLKALSHCKHIGAIAQIHAENGDAIREVSFMPICLSSFQSFPKQ